MTVVEKVFGDAGCGKTRFCINKINELLSNGVEPSEIGYLTFSKSQSLDARKRIENQTDIVLGKDSAIGTFHSITSRQLNLAAENWLKNKHKRIFCESLGIQYYSRNDNKIKTEYEETEDNLQMPGNCLIDLYNDCMNRYAKQPVDLNEKEILSVFIAKGLDSKHDFFSLNVVDFFKKYYDFKKKYDLYDYMDVIYKYYKDGLFPDVDYLFIDEVQDLGFLLQRILFNCIKSKRMKNIYVVGDEKQAIYGFMGSEPSWFVDLAADNEITFEKTYRCPEEVWSLAKSIESKMKNIKHRDVQSNGKKGFVEIKDFCNMFDMLKIIRKYDGKKVYCLFRTNKQEKEFSDFLIQNNVLFTGIKKRSIFTDKLIHLNNAIYKISKGLELDFIEVDYLFKCLPAKPFFERGAKSKWSKERKNFGSLKKFDKAGLSGLGFIYGLVDYWSDIEFLVNSLNNVMDLQKLFLSNNCSKILGDVNVFLGTIHSSKGLEAEVVLLSGDSPSLMELSNEELAIWYTAVTRCSDSLFVFCNLFDGCNSNNFNEAVV